MRSILVLVAILAAALTAFAAPPTPVLCINAHTQMGHETIGEALRDKYDIQLVSRNFRQITPELLRQFNAVVLFDMSRVDEHRDHFDHVLISREHFERLSKMLHDYVRAGGGLYVFGRSHTHMGDALSTRTLSEFLAPLDAAVLYEEVADPPTMVERRPLPYCQAAQLAEHPVTAGVDEWWYPVGRFNYGAATRPLRIGDAWTPLVRTSEQFTVKPWAPTGKKPPEKSAVTGDRAVIMAAREVGQGRVVLNGSESTISIWSYGYSDYADQHYGRMGMENNPRGGKSDGLRLLANALKWVAAPSLESGAMGGYVLEPEPEFVPKQAEPITWPETQKFGRYVYRKGLIGALPELGGMGRGTVADYAAAARELELDFLVCLADFERIDHDTWERFQAACAEATDDKLLVVPGIVTRDERNVHFIETGADIWPREEWLSKEMPKRVRNHLGYWMNQGGFTFRAPFLLGRGEYPAEALSTHNSFAIRTWQDGELLDDATDAYLQNQEQGNRSRIVSVSLSTAPETLAAAGEFTYVSAGDRERLAKVWKSQQHSGGSIGYVSQGPRLPFWHLVSGTRHSLGESYVPGTERFRAMLAVQSDVPLKTVSFYDSTRLFRRYDVSGETELELIVDLLHDTRRSLVAVVEDEQGRIAVSGAIANHDTLFRQVFCSDRCNIMGGSMTVRDEEGRLDYVPATSSLYKSGRLSWSAVSAGEELPGVDGSGLGSLFSMSPAFAVSAEGPGGDGRAIVHQIFRPVEHAEAIVFRTPIVKRSPEPGHFIYGHSFNVRVEEPAVDAELQQYYYYRQPLYPAATLADLAITITHPDGATLKPGFQWPVRWTSTWGKYFAAEIIRAPGNEREPHSVTGDNGNWRGELDAGDGVWFPELGEGFFYLGGSDPFGVAIESRREDGWFRMYTGLDKLGDVPAGHRFHARILSLKTASDKAPAERLASFLGFRDAFGIAGAPAYTVQASTGKVLSTNYELRLEAEGGQWRGKIAAADLPQMLPVHVHGLNPNWTAARIDLARNQWFPRAVWQGQAIAVVDLRAGDQDIFFGNVVQADNPELRLTLLPQQESGTVLDVHNPTDEPITSAVRVVIDSFLAPAQEHQVTVPPMSTKRLLVSE